MLKTARAVPVPVVWMFTSRSVVEPGGAAPTAGGARACEIALPLDAVALRPITAESVTRLIAFSPGPFVTSVTKALMAFMTGTLTVVSGTARPVADANVPEKSCPISLCPFRSVTGPTYGFGGLDSYRKLASPASGFVPTPSFTAWKAASVGRARPFRRHSPAAHAPGLSFTNRTTPVTVRLTVAAAELRPLAVCVALYWKLSGP